MVHAAEDNTIRVALVGCGGRGTGAADNALSTKQGPIKLVAMADVFKDRLDDSYSQLKEEHNDKSRRRCDHKFVGFDGYKKAMDCLRAGDVVILATPPAFRWVHFSYAIEKGIQRSWRSRSRSTGPTTRRMLALGEQAKKKNLKVGVGLMCRHCEAREELFKRIKDGEIGDIVLLAGLSQAGPVGSALTPPKPEGISELTVPDPAVPRLPLGQRRLFQRLLDPQHRRMLLDEGRMAGQSPGHRAAGTTAATTSIRTSTPTRSSTPSPTAPSCSSKAETSTAASRNSPATPTAPRARRSFPPIRTAPPTAASTRARR